MKIYTRIRIASDKNSIITIDLLLIGKDKSKGKNDRDIALFFLVISPFK